MMENYNVGNSLYDKAVDKFIEGKISGEELKQEFIKAEEKNTSKGKTKVIRGESQIEYALTKSYIEYALEDENIHIQKAFSVHQNQGGFSFLLSELEKIAEQNKISQLTLNVWSKNKDALEKYASKGFQEVGTRQYIEVQGSLISMQKKL
jgi:hypothetical protein